MIKLLFCLRRRPDLSPEAFHRYWRETHGPLVAKHAPTLRIRRYLQSHTVESPTARALAASRGGGEPFDGVAELWWDSEADLAAATATPAGQAAGAELLEDEARFIDHARSAIWLAEEHRVVGA
jgi:uncharacterized protein (TIGR02118 family)